MSPYSQGTLDMTRKHKLDSGHIFLESVTVEGHFFGLSKSLIVNRLSQRWIHLDYSLVYSGYFEPLYVHFGAFSDER